MTQMPSFSLVSPGDVARGAGDVILAAGFPGSAPPRDGLPRPLAAALDRLVAHPRWEGRKGQSLETLVDDGCRVVLHGLGPAAKVTLRQIDAWIYEALERVGTDRVETAVVLLPDHPALQAGALGEWLGRTITRATYRFIRFRHGEETAPRMQAVELVLPAALAAGDGGRVATAVAHGVALCRDLANTPANEATPAWMDDQAAALAADLGMRHTSLGPAELAERGMGGVLAVGSGSSNEPRLARLEWGESGPLVALVGKGVTFDTGGISIKPAKDMDEMKYDKCGACTVLGVARTVAELELPLRLRVYVPLAENMPDGRSYRPGDIVRCYNGKTVEIVNTDAEGRMILADALAWAAEEGPDLLLEYSTLTGASVVALGQDAASLYSPDDELASGLLGAAERTGERLWRMPLWPEFCDRMKGAHADLKNSGSRWGGANTAAAFLSHFMGDAPRWAHLDIAGGAYVGRDAEEEPGATGYGVAFTVDWLRRFQG
jgi:leucyl aminopeptidase